MCRLNTRLTEFQLNHRCLLCLAFNSYDQQSDECTRRRMFLSSQNLYKCKQAVYCVFCLCSSLKNCCCYLSAIFFFFCILHFVVDFLFICPFIYFFYADVVAIFLFLKSPCSSRQCVGLLDEKPGFEFQARHQNEVRKVNLWRFSLSRFLAKTLRVNKKLP